MNHETAILAAMLAFGIASAVILLIDALVKRIKARARLVSAKALNDCKPGCFMQNKNWTNAEAFTDDAHPQSKRWEDLT